jgi:taurine dioxygenase
VLQLLHDALAAPEVQLRWRWAPGDVVLWDETATCHRALGDHAPARRVVRRCTVAGDAPVPASPAA